MNEKVVELYLQWEPDQEGSNNGEDHIFAKVVQSEVPHLKQNKYLCGIEFSKVPSIDAIGLEQIIAPGFRRKTMLKNLCQKCLEELNRRYPIGK